MSTCRACGGPARKTVLALVVEHHRQQTGRVCQKCASGGLLVVAKVAPFVISGRPTLSKKVARELLSPVIKTLEGQLKAIKGTGTAPGILSDSAFFDGKAEQLENIIATLKAVEA